MRLSQISVASRIPVDGGDDEENASFTREGFSEDNM